MKTFVIGNLEISKTRAEAEVRRAQRAGRPPSQVYQLAFEHFRSKALEEANKKTLRWVC